MPMAQNACKIIPFRPAQVQERDERAYTERDVKTILYAFTRDYERRRNVKPAMRSDALKKFIAAAFEV